MTTGNETTTGNGANAAKVILALVLMSTVAVVMVLIVWLLSPTGSSRTKTSTGAQEEAFLPATDGPIVCKAAIIKSLKDPSSASFVGGVDGFKSDQGYHFEIKLRAKNSFNATVLSTFDCTITNSGVVLLREQQSY